MGTKAKSIVLVAALALAAAVAAAPGAWIGMAVASPHAEQTRTSQRMAMSFIDTDLALVLKAIGVQTGVNIVYASKEKVSVTVSLAANSPEDAVRAASAAAGLIYRKAGDVFIVAPVNGMKQALEPYGTTVRFTVAEAYAQAIATKLQEAMPMASVNTSADKIVFTGLVPEVPLARSFVEEYAKYLHAMRPVSDYVLVQAGNASEIAKILGALSPNVKVTATGSEVERGGALALVGPELDIAKAKELALRLDVPFGKGPDPMVFRVYKLKYSSAPSVSEFLKTAAPRVQAIVGPEAYSPPRGNFAPLTSQLKTAAGGEGGGGGGGGAGGGGQQQQQQQQQGAGGGQQAKPGDKASVMVLIGPEGAVEAALALVESIDLRPQQVVVEVKVFETSPAMTEKIGIDWSWSALRFFETPAGTQVTGGLGNFLSDFQTRPPGLGQISRAPFTFQGTLNALISSGEARILANPSVQVLDNNDASVFIGDTIRARISQATGLGAVTVEVVEFPVGIILLIRPRINADGNITMHVNPVVSSVTAIDADNVPQTSSREAETTVMVKDGETIVIGGLIRDEHSKVVSAVPFLSKLPIVGELFKNRTTTKKRTEIVVTITPRIVKDVEDKNK